MRMLLHPEDSYLAHRACCEVAALFVKLRHLMEQSFGRVIRAVIYQPADELLHQEHELHIHDCADQAAWQAAWAAVVPAACPSFHFHLGYVQSDSAWWLHQAASADGKRQVALFTLVCRTESFGCQELNKKLVGNSEL